MPRFVILGNNSGSVRRYHQADHHHPGIVNLRRIRPSSLIANKPLKKHDDDPSYATVRERVGIVMEIELKRKT